MAATDDRPITAYVFTRYDDPAAADEPYDARYPAVAQQLVDLIQGRLPGAQVEHIGSTAIPGCAGKGVVDMMVIYPDDVQAARNAVEALGFQAFVAREPFPAERPVYVGSIKYDGTSFRTHAHLMPVGWPEIETQRTFRDRLQANPELVAEYVALKRAVLAAGTNDSVDYNEGKSAFIQAVISGER